MKLEQILINYCKQFGIEPLRDKSFLLLTDLIKSHQIQSILEIGTGVGLTDYKLVQHFPNIFIDTVEINYQKYTIAKEVLMNYHNINFFNTNCFDFVTTKQYDLIFIDGPKKNQIALLDKMMQYCHLHTIIFIDNIILSKLRNNLNKTKNQQKIIDSLDEFVIYLKNHKTFDFKYYDIEDGIMIGTKKCY